MLVPRTVGIAEHFGVTRPLPPAFPADIDKDDPAVGLRRRLGFLPAAERAEQRDLDCVFCLLPAPKQHERCPQHGVGEVLHESGERHLARSPRPAHANTPARPHNCIDAGPAVPVPVPAMSRVCGTNGAAMSGRRLAPVALHATSGYQLGLQCSCRSRRERRAPVRVLTAPRHPDAALPPNQRDHVYGHVRRERAFPVHTGVTAEALGGPWAAVIADAVVAARGGLERLPATGPGFVRCAWTTPRVVWTVAAPVVSSWPTVSSPQASTWLRASSGAAGKVSIPPLAIRAASAKCRSNTLEYYRDRRAA